MALFGAFALSIVAICSLLLKETSHLGMAEIDEQTWAPTTCAAD